VDKEVREPTDYKAHNHPHTHTHTHTHNLSLSLRNNAALSTDIPQAQIVV